jgi:polyhydroxyalkanoate synthesis regulator phasin
VKADYNQQLLDRAQAYVGQPLTARRYEQGLAELSAIYGDITGEAVGSCRQCQVSDFMAVVTAYIREATRFLHPEIMENSKYTFAPGFQNEVIADSRYGKVVKAENLTDKDAEKLIPLGYGHVIVLKAGQEGEAATAEGEQGTEVVTENPLVPQAHLEAEQTAHAATKQALADEKEHSKTALKTEKDAHTATKKELTASKKQVTELSKELGDLQKQLADAQAKVNPATDTTVVDGADSTPA